MKKKLLLFWTFLLCMMGAVSAQEVTLDFSTNNWGLPVGSSNKGTTAQTFTNGTYTISLEATSSGYYFNNTGYLMLGKTNAALTLPAFDFDVEKIEVVGNSGASTSTKQNIYVGETAVSTETTGSTGTNTYAIDAAYQKSGNVYILKVTSSHNAQITSIKIYKKEITTSIAAPTITGTTPFFGSTEITMACETEGASIYYTTDGITPPTAESTLYTTPFTIEATTTIQAIAIKGEDKSSIRTEEFVAIPVLTTVAELNALADNTTFRFDGENAIVVAKQVKNGTQNYVYIKDETGSSLIFDKDGSKTADATVGKTLTAGWTGKVSIFNGLFELVPDAALAVNEGNAVEVTYDETPLSDVTAENVNKVVALKGVTYTEPDGSNFNITKGETTVAGYNQFGIEIAAPTEGETYDMVGAIGIYSKDDATTIQFQPITITRAPKVVPAIIDVTEGDIAAAVAAKKSEIEAAGDKIGDITINLTKDAAYTVNGTIEAPAAVVINGNGATVDASALISAMILMSKTPSVEANENDFYPINDIVIKDVKVTGLTQQLFYANGVKYLMNNLICENSIIQVNGGNKTVFDFNGGGVTGKLDINKSTIYANPQNTGALYSSQSGNKATEAGLEKQTISILNSTLYNIAYNKNVNSHRQSNQTWLEYIVKDNIVLDCGKKGQFIKGLNGGQNGKNPTWAIDRNTFLFTVDGVITNTGAEESTGDADEPITNNLVTDPAFADAANGDFHIGKSTQQAKFQTGDPRWLVEYEAGDLYKTELENEITAATTLLGDASTEEGTPGADLKAAIESAQAALENAEFQEEINAALAALKAAEEAYKLATGINEITTGAGNDNGAWYNLQGVRIEKPTQKGIYIHNGKKTAIK